MSLVLVRVLHRWARGETVVSLLRTRGLDVRRRREDEEEADEWERRAHQREREVVSSGMDARAGRCSSYQRSALVKALRRRLSSWKVKERKEGAHVS